MIGAPLPLAAALSPSAATGASVRWLLSLTTNAAPLRAAFAALLPGAPVTLLSGPEGGFTAEELTAAQAAGWRPVTLGARVLRAETAPLTALAVLTMF
jgi:16S rRNA (uracil1498-N3)-methyltransferase